MIEGSSPPRCDYLIGSLVFQMAVLPDDSWRHSIHLPSVDCNEENSGEQAAAALHMLSAAPHLQLWATPPGKNPPQTPSEDGRHGPGCASSWLRREPCPPPRSAACGGGSSCTPAPPHPPTSSSPFLHPGILLLTCPRCESWE